MNLPKKYRGVSLLELIFVIGIFSFLTLAAGSFFIRTFQFDRIIGDQLFGQKEGRRIISEIVNVVRTAETSSVGGYPIGVASTSTLTIYANIDSDTLRERVRYWLEGTNLKKGVLKPTGSPLAYSGQETVTILAQNVRNNSINLPVFQYYDESYTGSGTSTALTIPVSLTSIRMVRVTVEINKQGGAFTSAPLRVESLTHIRNTKTN